MESNTTKPQKPTQSISPQVASPKQPLWLKVVLLIIAITAGMGIGVLAYNAPYLLPPPPPSEPTIVPSTPTSTPTSTWQTYRSQEYGFEFEYANEYQLDSRYFKLLDKSPVPNSANYYCEPDFFESLHIVQKKYENQIEFPAIYLHLIGTKKEITSIIDDCIMGAEGIWKRDSTYGNPDFLDAPDDFPGPSVLSREIVSYDSITVNKMKHLLRPTNILVLNYFYGGKGLFVIIADSEEEQVTDQILSSFRFIE
ncbi:hypothetical protein HY468_04565 [Candidatus Roizmanbacteria bacterium]|nr:hypothetical protein [Candidatus Roizmanbacteria bacterium]